MSQEEAVGTNEAVATEQTGAEVAGAGETTQETVAETGGESTQVESAQTEYQPNLKFKVMDAEHEFNPILANVIKDAESEKYFRELYEKAYGLDHVKPKYEKTKQEFDSYRQKWDPVEQDIEKIREFLTNKDYGSFFNTFGLTDEAVMEYAVNRLQYYQLPPEQREQMDLQQKRNSEYANLKLENQRLKQSYEHESVAKAAETLEQTLNSPEISAISTEFDTRAGQPGQFKNAVITYAQGVYASTGKDLSVPEAVQGFIKTFALQAGGNSAAQQTGPAVSQQAPAQRAKTLPGSNNSGKTPVAPKVKTLQDLIELRNNLQA